MKENAEIEMILKNPRLSLEMRNGLEQRVAALRTEIAANTAHRTDAASLETTNRPGPPSK
jgi:uncharacterized small protein (DUF1192 family)